MFAGANQGWPRGGDDRLERANIQKFSAMFVTLSCVVVPTKTIAVLVLGELMRSVAERLIQG
ncbi:hypothetical protein QN375_16440 [Pseudomonas sp. MH9.2]|nr:hypothetical protein [Pseudomonas sp. MH9.2]MEE3507487.1 hypothetical protein [Pseudomonas sp. 10C3]